MSAERDYVVLVDTSVGTASISLPAFQNGRNVIIKDVGYSGSINNITLTLTGSDFFSFNGSSSYTLSSNGAEVSLQTDQTYNAGLVSFAGYPSTRIFTDFAAMSSSLVTNTDSIHELRSKTDGSLIGRWIWDAVATGSVPVGDINLENVSTSYIGFQHSTSSTTGLTRLLQAGHNMPSSGNCTIWSMTGSSTIATGVSFTVSGDTITFGSDPGQSLVDDGFHVEGRCEFGEMRTTAQSGKWVCGGNSLIGYWNSGLTSHNISGSGFVIMSFAKMPAENTPRFIHINGEILFETSDNTAGNFLSFGYRANNAGKTTAGLYYTTSWLRSATIGQNADVPAWFTADTIGSSLSNDTLQMGWVSNPSDTSDIQFMSYCVSGSNSGLTQGNLDGNIANPAVWYAQDTGGPIENFFVWNNGQNNAWKLKKIRYMAYQKMAVFEGVHNAKIQNNQISGDYSVTHGATLLEKKKVVLLVDSSGSATTLQFSASTSYPSHYFYIKDIAGSASVNNITINLAAGDTFNGGATGSVISTDYASIALFPISGVWHSASLSTTTDNLTKYTDYASMSSSLVANPTSLGALYNKSDQTATGLIGYWIYDSNLGGVTPVGTVNFENVTDSQWSWQATASPTTGLTRTLRAENTLPASGTCTIWDRSGGVEIATGVGFTMSGSTITFDSDPGTTGDTDFFFTEGLCEFGELREAGNGGVWVPSSNSTIYWESGLKSDWAASVFSYTSLNISPVANKARPLVLSMVAEVYVSGAASTTNYHVGFGYIASGKPGYEVSAINYSTGWKRAHGGQSNLTTAPGLTSTDATGDPVGQTIYLGISSCPSDANDVQITYTAYGDGLTAGNNAVNLIDTATGTQQSARPDSFIYTGKGIFTQLKKLKFIGV